MKLSLEKPKLQSITVLHNGDKHVTGTAKNGNFSGIKKSWSNSAIRLILTWRRAGTWRLLSSVQSESRTAAESRYSAATAHNTSTAGRTHDCSQNSHRVRHWSSNSTQRHGERSQQILVSK